MAMVISAVSLQKYYSSLMIKVLTLLILYQSHLEFKLKSYAPIIIKLKKEEMRLHSVH